MADRTNKFLKEFKKNNYNSTSTEDIVESLVALEEKDAGKDADTKAGSDNDPKDAGNADVNIINKEETAAKDITKTALPEEKEEETASKKGRKTAKKGERKSNAGRKPFKTGDYKKITIDIPQELYDAMQDFLGAFDNNMTSYIKIALTNDINQNYEEYLKKAKVITDNKPILSIKRK